MKKILILATALLILSASDSSFQNAEIINDISTALNTGSSKELTKFFNNVVELKIDGVKENYSRPQAEVIIRKFFTNNPPVKFEKIHNGSSPEGLLYILGKYSHKEGSHRVYMLIKQSGGEYKIDTFDLTKE